MRVFISHYDSPRALALAASLRAAGAAVEHSPHSPHSPDGPNGDDPRFADWYERGLPAAVARCEAFVIVLNGAWDSSTWMMREADAGYRRARADPAVRLFVWDPEGRYRHAPPPVGVRAYLAGATALPDEFREAAAVVLGAA